MDRTYCPKHAHFVEPCVRCKQEAETANPKLKARRHKWVYPEKHVYVCKQCGIRKVNFEKERGWWVQTYRSPVDGSEFEAEKVPPCVDGPLTAKFLDEYRDAVDANARKNPAPSTVLPDDWTPPF